MLIVSTSEKTWHFPQIFFLCSQSWMCEATAALLIEHVRAVNAPFSPFRFRFFPAPRGPPLKSVWHVLGTKKCNQCAGAARLWKREECHGESEGCYCEGLYVCVSMCACLSICFKKRGGGGRHPWLTIHSSASFGNTCQRRLQSAFRLEHRPIPPAASVIAIPISRLSLCLSIPNTAVVWLQS